MHISSARRKALALGAALSLALLNVLTANAATTQPNDSSALPRPILIADEGNNRMIIVDPAGKVRWSFPQRGDLKQGQTFRTPDDVFFSPDGKEIIATESEHQLVSVIDIATRKIVFEYGVASKGSAKKGSLHNPDDAMILPDGRIIVADIKNCRVLFINRTTRATSQLGQTGRCLHNPPTSFGSPNGAFPMADGRYLVTEINGNWVDAMTLDGKVSWAVHPPGIKYPSDTNEVSPNVYLTVDFSSPGAIVEFDSKGKLLWKFKPTGKEALNHTSLAHILPNGKIIATDDKNHRVIVVDVATKKIVWQYGHKGVSGVRPGYLNNPDGLELVPESALTSLGL